MKRLTMFLVLIFAIILLSGCKPHDPAIYQHIEQPHLYWKDIDVVVTNTDKRHWFATTHRYMVSLTVQSEEYGLTRTFQFDGLGLLGCPAQWEYEIGDTVKAELYSWVLDSTGEVIRREIAKVY